MEKTVLLNAKVAEQIAATIALHTRGDTRTVFFDGEGGPCHIGARVRDMGLFRSGEVAAHCPYWGSILNFAIVTVLRWHVGWFLGFWQTKLLVGGGLDPL